jgi:hypothetical protein
MVGLCIKPGQNYFYSNGYDLLNEMLANGSTLSAIDFFFCTLTVFIKHNKTTMWQLYFSALFVFNINDDVKN